ncbi:MAG: Rrf2 family transcriptional regulator [Phycisphaerae bacterium]|nr:Rrf2 family transcriptional regulator [Phycisphaerae bacterium]
MNISQKCQYGLRAVLELSLRVGQGAVKTGDIAAAQSIPLKFLEVILVELKRGGFVESRRGVNGGYLLVGKPSELTAGAIITFIDGPIMPVDCTGSGASLECPQKDKCVFLDMWTDARDAVADIYNGTTFQYLVDKYQNQITSDFCI